MGEQHAEKKNLTTHTFPLPKSHRIAGTLFVRPSYNFCIISINKDHQDDKYTKEVFTLESGKYQCCLDYITNMVGNENFFSKKWEITDLGPPNRICKTNHIESTAPPILGVYRAFRHVLRSSFVFANNVIYQLK